MFFCDDLGDDLLMASRRSRRQMAPRLHHVFHLPRARHNLRGSSGHNYTLCVREGRVRPKISRVRPKISRVRPKISRVLETLDTKNPMISMPNPGYPGYPGFFSSQKYCTPSHTLSELGQKPWIPWIPWIRPIKSMGYGIQGHLVPWIPWIFRPPSPIR